MKKVVRLTESDLIKIVKRVIKEDEESSESQACTLKMCQGKTFKANSLDRLNELFRFMYQINLVNGFKQVNYGVDKYPPAPAPSNSAYDPGTKVAWEFVNPEDPSYKVRVSQMNECVKSCPVIMTYYSRGGTDGGYYSLLDDSDFQRFKTDIKKLYEKAATAGQY